mmetsp:Transcript_49270/g.101681  ORF Transcript_49270/g.101681 Transcript_49270/m.101681 type:complete len:212 (-) Transcript_49270:120-755(-)|eukprot:s4363_g8.t1
MEAPERSERESQERPEHPERRPGPSGPLRAKAKTRRQLLEAYVTREDQHRKKHYDFCSKQVLSVYTTFPRPFFSREDFRSHQVQTLHPPVQPTASPVTASVARSDEERSAERPPANWGRSPRFPVLLPNTKESLAPEAVSTVSTPRKADRLLLLKTSPAWSFGWQGVGRRYPGAPPRGPRDTDFRSLRDSLVFDDSRLLEDPRSIAVSEMR